MLEFRIDKEKCTRCGECVKDCPYMVIRMEEGEVPHVVEERAEQCIACQHCLGVCKPGALSIHGFDPSQSLPLKGNLPRADEVKTLLMGRRSVRRYKAQPLAPEVIADLLDVAAHAPTGVNNRQVLFTVVEDPAVMAQVRESTYEGIRKALKAGGLPKGLEFFEGFLNLWDDKKIDVLFRNAPHLLLVSSPKGGPCPEADCHIALSYFEIYAASLGLGTLWNGLVKWAIASIAPELGQRLGIPASHVLGYVMVFGHPAVHYHRTVQRPCSNVNRVLKL